MSLDSQAMRDLKAVANAQDFELAATAAMLAAHEQAKIQDQESMMMLQTKLDVCWSIVSILQQLFWLRVRVTTADLVHCMSFFMCSD
jgi:hypothetical protein